MPAFGALHADLRGLAHRFDGAQLLEPALRLDVPRDDLLDRCAEAGVRPAVSDSASTLRITETQRSMQSSNGVGPGGVWPDVS